jgi:hypothetical protein
MIIGQIYVHAQKPAFPIKPAENGHYLVDNNNKPFFYQAETPWLIFVNLNEKEMGELMDIRINQGFTVFQTMALTTGTNVNGDNPFENNDFTKPNLAYFKHIRKGIQLAEQKGLLVGVALAWKGCCGGDWTDIILQNGTKSCREYGRFLGKYFANCKNLFWIQGGDADPQGHTDHYREMALGIKESMPDVMQTYHASSGHSSSDVMNYLDNPWLNFSWTYTYFRNKHNVWIYLCGWGELPEVYEMNHIEYRKYPVKPFVLGESQYEGEDTVSCKPFSFPEIVRRQAYWSVLSGSCGHAYGSWCWTVNKKWRNVEHDNGAKQMVYVKDFFESIAWHKLVPDIHSEIITNGAGTYGKTDYAVAAYIPGENCMVIYVPPSGIESRTLVIQTSKMKKVSSARWYNPTNGNYLEIPLKTVNKISQFSIKTPGNNGENSNDWILLMN